jgi:hypothetical protein
MSSQIQKTMFNCGLLTAFSAALIFALGWVWPYLPGIWSLVVVWYGQSNEFMLSIMRFVGRTPLIVPGVGFFIYAWLSCVCFKLGKNLDEDRMFKRFWFARNCIAITVTLLSLPILIVQEIAQPYDFLLFIAFVVTYMKWATFDLHALRLRRLCRESA